MPVPELTPETEPSAKTTLFSAALDCSSYPEIAAYGAMYADQNGDPMPLPDLLESLKVPAVRLRLWVNPANGHSSLKDVKDFATQLQQKGIKVWLSLHYSDTWADPGKQAVPLSWEQADFETLKDSLATYTARVAKEIQPAIIQIGNEINDGLLFPSGQLSVFPEQCLDLLQAGIDAVRRASPETAVMIHFAGINGATRFFKQMEALSYDLIGLSYYPLWHGHSLRALDDLIKELTETHNKELWIAETAYPFTLDWNDWTHNIVGLEEQLILPDFPATPEGQESFVRKLQEIMDKYTLARGVCYWGAELIAWKGPVATDASPWENQALFDFSNRALPALDLFSGE